MKTSIESTKKDGVNPRAGGFAGRPGKRFACAWRFLALAWLFKRYGEPIRHFIEKRLGPVVAGVAVAVILLFAATRFL